MDCLPDSELFGDETLKSKLNSPELGQKIWLQILLVGFFIIVPKTTLLLLGLGTLMGFTTRKELRKNILDTVEHTILLPLKLFISILSELIRLPFSAAQFLSQKILCFLYPIFKVVILPFLFLARVDNSAKVSECGNTYWWVVKPFTQGGVNIYIWFKAESEWAKKLMKDVVSKYMYIDENVSCVVAKNLDELQKYLISRYPLYSCMQAQFNVVSKTCNQYVDQVLQSDALKNSYHVGHYVALVLLIILLRWCLVLLIWLSTKLENPSSIILDRLHDGGEAVRSKLKILRGFATFATKLQAPNDIILDFLPDTQLFGGETLKSKLKNPKLYQMGWLQLLISPLTFGLSMASFGLIYWFPVPALLVIFFGKVLGLIRCICSNSFKTERDGEIRALVTTTEDADLQSVLETTEELPSVLELEATEELPSVFDVTEEQPSALETTGELPSYNRESVEIRPAEESDGPSQRLRLARLSRFQPEQCRVQREQDARRQEQNRLREEQENNDQRLRELEVDRLREKQQNIALRLKELEEEDPGLDEVSEN